jgi:hypothetical protein
MRDVFRRAGSEGVREANGVGNGGEYVRCASDAEAEPILPWDQLNCLIRMPSVVVVSSCAAREVVGRAKFGRAWKVGT